MQHASFLQRLIPALAATLALCACDARHEGSANAATTPAPATSGPPPSIQMAAPPLAVPPPDLPEETLLTVTSTPSPRNLDVSVLRMGRLAVALERTYLRDVQTQIGAGVFDEQGDGGDFRTWLCYTIPHSQRIWLISSQTAVGQYVNSFVLVRDQTAEPSDHCPALPAQYAPIALEPADLRIGTPERQVEHLFGGSQQSDTWSTYSRTDSSNHDSLHFDIAHWLAVQYGPDGAVSALAARKSTSN